MTIIIILIILIGGIVAIAKFKGSKKEEGFSAILFTSGMSLVTSAQSGLLDKSVVIIGVLTDYKDAKSLDGDFNYWYFGLGIFLIFVSIWMNLNLKKKLYILNINGYIPRKIENYFQDLKMSNFDFKEREIDFIRIYKDIFSKKLDDESFNCIKEDIKYRVEAFKNETCLIKRGYTGIAPIPFVMYAGTFLERTGIDSYYEFDKIESQTYYKLNEDSNQNYPELKLITNIDNLSSTPKDIVLAISLTQKITQPELSQFINEDIVHMSINNPTDNAIRSKEQLQNYVNLIFRTIEEIGKKLPDLETIHLVYSGQSCLPLEIGKRSIDDTRIPQLISYQFEKQQAIKYPWGIVINGQEKGTLIKYKR